jgi:hypothetical protein
MEAFLDKAAARSADSCFGIEASISRTLRAATARKYAERTVLRVSVSKVDVKE